MDDMARILCWVHKEKEIISFHEMTGAECKIFYSKDEFELFIIRIVERHYRIQ